MSVTYPNYSGCNITAERGFCKPEKKGAKGVFSGTPNWVAKDNESPLKIVTITAGTNSKWLGTHFSQGAPRPRGLVESAIIIDAANSWIRPPPGRWAISAFLRRQNRGPAAQGSPTEKEKYGTFRLDPHVNTGAWDTPSAFV